jgi:hypothetical protein
MSALRSPPARIYELRRVGETGNDIFATMTYKNVLQNGKESGKKQLML